MHPNSKQCFPFYISVICLYYFYLFWSDVSDKPQKLSFERLIIFTAAILNLSSYFL